MKPVTYLFSLFLLASLSCKKDKAEPESNPWDGRYRVEGTLEDIREPEITYPGPQELHLKPADDGSIEVISKELEMSGHLILHGTSLSYYSKFGLVLRIDPTTNKINFLANSYGQPSENGRSAVLDPSGANSFDPATKTIRIKYWMDEAGFSGHRTSFDETWTYIGAR